MTVEDTPALPVRPRRGPAPIWLGAVALFLLTLGAAILLSYGLLDLAWQQRWGGWNAWLGTLLVISTVIPLRLWNPSGPQG